MSAVFGHGAVEPVEVQQMATVVDNPDRHCPVVGRCMPLRGGGDFFTSLLVSTVFVLIAIVVLSGMDAWSSARFYTAGVASSAASAALTVVRAPMWSMKRASAGQRLMSIEKCGSHDSTVYR